MLSFSGLSESASKMRVPERFRRAYLGFPEGRFPNRFFPVPLQSGSGAFPPGGTRVIRETWALQLAVIPVPPWREESIPETFGDALSTDWIPAFAGMTALTGPHEKPTSRK